MDRSAEIFRAIPDLPVVIEHTGVPPARDAEQMREWRRALAAFAVTVPHARLRISAPNFIADPRTRDQAGPVVREAIEIYGPERCMLGSNFPVERASTSYARLWQEYDQMTADRSASQRSAIFSGTAASFYRIF